jgi:hypothetical protein
MTAMTPAQRTERDDLARLLTGMIEQGHFTEQEMADAVLAARRPTPAADERVVEAMRATIHELYTARDVAIAERDAALARVAVLEAALRERDAALAWHVQRPTEHASVEEWEKWYRSEPGCAYRVGQAALTATQGGPDA